MKEHEALACIEDMLLHARWYLYETYMGSISYRQAVKNIQEELDKLQDIITDVDKGEPDYTDYLLTETNFGAPAYLRVISGEGDTGDSYVVISDEQPMTGVKSYAKSALEDYFNICTDSDFVHDFWIGYDNGECKFGVSNYAQYVEKCFRRYFIGR